MHVFHVLLVAACSSVYISGLLSDLPESVGYVCDIFNSRNAGRKLFGNHNAFSYLSIASEAFARPLRQQLFQW